MPPNPVWKREIGNPNRFMTFTRTASTIESIIMSSTDGAVDVSVDATVNNDSNSEKKVVVLRSSDGETFEVEEKVVLQSQTIKHMIEDDCADSTIPIPNVTGSILAKVIEYCKRHSDSDNNNNNNNNEEEEALKSFDAEFATVDQATLFDLILAANYLNIASLLDLTCQTVADMIKGKSPEEIRALFNIKNDFSPEEEAEVRRENAWAFE